jgi:hypothetical protein
LGINKVIADLYFTLPFDLGIIDATQKSSVINGAGISLIEDYGKIFIGEPYETDKEVSDLFNLQIEYLDLIESGKSQLET